MKHTLERLLIPRTLCEFFSDAQIHNGGLKKTRSIKVFYSQDTDARLDFTLQVKKKFNRNSSACYEANVLKFFGKLAVIYVDLMSFLFSCITLSKETLLNCFSNSIRKAHQYLRRKRSVLPVDYCERRRNRKNIAGAKFDADSQTQNRDTVVIKLEEEVQRLKNAWNYLNHIIGVESIDDNLSSINIPLYEINASPLPINTPVHVHEDTSFSGILKYALKVSGSTKFLVIAHCQ